MRAVELFSQEELCGCEWAHDMEINSVAEHSDLAKAGCVFVCHKGSTADGTSFIPQAYSNGCRAFVSYKKVKAPRDSIVIIVKNTRKRAAELSAALNGNPERKLKIIGITGTKGKTTTAELLYKVLVFSGKKAVLISTLGVSGLPKVKYSLDNTTPPPSYIFGILRMAKDIGAEYVIIEVSSQSLAEYRVFGIPFCLGIFTSFSPDHVGDGEHRSVEDYFSAKRRLFTDYGIRVAVVNSCDPSWCEMTRGVERVIKCGVSEEDDFRIEKIRCSIFGTEFSMGGKKFSLSLCGKHNAINAALAISCASYLTGKPIAFFDKAVTDVRISGRFEIYTLAGRFFVIDFAHNGESVKKICTEVRTFTPGKIIIVYGSVGKRTFSRRCELAENAEKYADISVLTADNPGEESVEKICRDIGNCYKDSSAFVIVPDRRRAIEYAYSISKAGDSVILAGKGHERYQLIGNEKLYFSEEKILKDMGARAVFCDKTE